MKKKLTSRKFWLALVGFATAIMVLFGVEDIKIEQVCALIGALGSLCAYILAEGYADGKSKNDEKKIEDAKKDENKS